MLWIPYCYMIRNHNNKELNNRLLCFFVGLKVSTVSLTGWPTRNWLWKVWKSNAITLMPSKTFQQSPHRSLSAFFIVNKPVLTLISWKRKLQWLGEKAKNGCIIINLYTILVLFIYLLRLQVRTVCFLSKTN